MRWPYGYRVSNTWHIELFNFKAWLKCSYIFIFYFHAPLTLNHDICPLHSLSVMFFILPFSLLCTYLKKCSISIMHLIMSETSITSMVISICVCDYWYFYCLLISFNIPRVAVMIKSVSVICICAYLRQEQIDSVRICHLFVLILCFHGVPFLYYLQSFIYSEMQLNYFSFHC